MVAQTENLEFEAVLHREDDDRIATLILNRPRQSNALSRELIQALADALADIAASESIRVVVIKGNGSNFCAGHDLQELRANRQEKEYRDIFDSCTRLMARIVALPQPVIAQVHGVATAAGCQLVATCDLAIAAQQALFATPGVNIGAFCSTPMVMLSRVIARKHAMEMLLTGEMIDAETALQYGLINHAVADENLDHFVKEFASKMATKSPAVLSSGKRAFYRQLECGLDEAYDFACAEMVRCMLAEDATEGIDAFFERRPPRWPK